MNTALGPAAAQNADDVCGRTNAEAFWLTSTPESIILGLERRTSGTVGRER